jgi:hypothetical protein
MSVSVSVSVSVSAGEQALERMGAQAVEELVMYAVC